jgi:hypothetical protein
MRYRKLRIALASFVLIAIFSISHFTIGLIGVLVEQDAAKARFFSKGAFRIFIALWWFPGIQILDVFQLHHTVGGLVVFIANSFLWGSIAFKLATQPFRFRLRTLLIATTLVAVVLGLAVWSMH